METLFPYEISDVSNNCHLRRLEINAMGQLCAFAELIYLSKPFPLYYFSWLKVLPEFQNQGLGRELLNYVNNMLAENGRAGLLVNTVDPSSPARDMYERHGWQPIPEKAVWMVFNCPEKATEQLPVAIHRINRTTDKFR